MIAETFAEVCFAAGGNEDPQLAVFEVECALSQMLVFMRLILDEVHDGNQPSIEKLDAMLSVGITRLGSLAQQVEVITRSTRSSALAAA